MKHLIYISLFLTLLCATLSAQTKPLPWIDQPLLPSATAPGDSDFTLTVNGTGFASSTVVFWNGSPRATNFVSTSSLQASITAADIAKAGTAIITVTNPGPGGGVSLPVYFFVRAAYPSVALVSTANLSNTGPVAVGDFNGDGNLDIAISQQGIPLNVPGTIQLYLGNGDGTFQTARATITDSDTTVQPTQMLTGDFDGDGKLDLLVGQFGQNGFSAAWPQVFFGNGDGTFTAGPTAGCGNGDYGGVGAVADLNKDGILDYLWRFEAPFTILDEVCLGNGDGTFRFSFDDNALSSAGPAVGDFDRDGKLDFFSADADGATFLGNGDGTFHGPLPPNTGGVAAIGDINLDGNLDVVTALGYVWLGNGDGTFTSASSLLNAFGNEIKLQDVRGSGKLDVVLLGSTLQVYPAATDVSGEFGSPIPFVIPTLAQYANLGMGDFNKDGRVDFVIPGSTSTVLFLQTRLNIAPLSIDYGVAPLGSSVVQTIALSNVGSPNLLIRAIRVVGVNAQDFTIPAKQCEGILTTGTPCSLQVTFTPATISRLKASLIIDYADVGSPQSIPLSGIGTPVSLTPGSVDFGDQKVGTISPPVSITVSNLSTKTVPISSIHASPRPPFGETNNCGERLAPHRTCEIQLRFAPTLLGLQTGTLTINVGAVEEAVSVSGNGT